MKKILSILVLSICTLSHATDLRVAAAANVLPCLSKITPLWNQKFPDFPTKITGGSSGTLSTQIQNGAPFDVFLSADAEYTKRLAETGFALAETQTVYTQGELVLWSSQPLKSQSFAIELSKPSVQHIALANPRLAPFGARAEAWLKTQKNYASLQAKLVFGDNVGQAAQFASTGNAEIAFVSRGQTLLPPLAGLGQVYRLKGVPALPQTAIVTHAAKDPAQAKAFIQFLVSMPIQKIWKSCGYLPAY